MIELKDGSLTDIEDFDSTLEKFNQLKEQTSAIYFGTREELEEKKEEIKLSDRVSELEKKIDELTPTKSSTLHIPDSEELKRFS